MTDIDILQKAMQLASERGWDFNERYEVDQVDIITNNFGNPVVLLGESDEANDGFDYQAIIFDHGFARALFGEDIASDSLIDLATFEWQAQIMRMVIADSPLKYLGEYLEH